MLHMEDPRIRSQLLKGSFGLELESLRITEDGLISQAEHPFPGNENIDRDFSEAQTEFNTPVYPDAASAVAGLNSLYTEAQKVLASLPRPECFWPFSNPPVLRGEEDVPVARYYGEKAQKTEYREYLSGRYGRYKMSLSGIHVNYSFSDELVRTEAALRGESVRETKDRLYLNLGQRAVEFGWIMTAVTAASPVLDTSYYRRNVCGGDDFSGMASVRCGELGYWNFFTPLLCYDDIKAYTDSMKAYVDNGMLRQFSELYYPVRLKPRGSYSLEGLREKGINHIELRMVDLNPLVYGGIDVRDVEFAQLLLAWLAAMDSSAFTDKDQIQCVQNFKSAAHYDLSTVRIVRPDGLSLPADQAAINMLTDMEAFYSDAPENVREVLKFEKRKFTHPETSYAYQIRVRYGEKYARKGLKLAMERRREALAR